ncbi:EpsG family protein [Lacticaseibacillus paracasei]|uniref:EpsG family protein n=1 Tax=Lacticaseibacillus paracasei TaxID=1597 RepID=UPI0021A7A6B0|nr:EpsG family protein [Lacticaseibacillus paracasei]MCT4384165.1 EpsG family protein [Lacticaseibacillus paracasei]
MLFLASEGLQFLNQFSKHKFQIVGVLGFLTLTYLAAVSDPIHNLDYQTYQAYYGTIPMQPVRQWHFEKGYSSLGVLFFHIGLSYQAFRWFLCLMTMVVMYIGVRRFTTRADLFAGIYGATVFLLDATQLRNFIMIAFVVLAMSFLQEVNWRNLLLAVMLILISAQFHSLGYLFLLVIFLRCLPFEWLYSYGLWFVGIVVSLILVISAVGVHAILDILAKFTSLVSSRSNLTSKVSSQYGDGSVLIRYVAVAVSTIAMFLLIWFLCKVIKTTADKKLMVKYQLLYVISLMAIIMLPTLSLADDYSRIPRSIFLFVIIAISLYYEHAGAVRLNKMRSLVTFLIVLVCAMNGFSHLYMWGTAFRGSLPYLIHLG